MQYANFKTLKQLKTQFKADIQYFSSLSTGQILEHLDDFEQHFTNWVYNYCLVEFLEENNYIDLFWTSATGKTYNLVDCFKEFTDFYNKVVKLADCINNFCSVIHDLSDPNWKF